MKQHAVLQNDGIIRTVSLDAMANANTDLKKPTDVSSILPESSRLPFLNGDLVIVEQGIKYSAISLSTIQGSAVADRIGQVENRDQFGLVRRVASTSAVVVSSEGPKDGRDSDGNYASPVVSDSIVPHIQFMCRFDSGIQGTVTVYSALPKGVERIREKLAEYQEEGAEWPLTACILDPVRASVVCAGPAQILEVAKWFTDSNTNNQSTNMVPCKIKNKFCLPRAETVSFCQLLLINCL